MTDTTKPSPTAVLNRLIAAAILAGPAALLRAFVIANLLPLFSTISLGVVQVMGLGAIFSLFTFKTSQAILVGKQQESTGVGPWNIVSTSILVSLVALGYGHLLALFL